ncbi:hypothetical protein TNCV_481111 [Trichonephila clavipes]|nr:hypothetical protein TNCV_481111 [Trichonephila clavipes]
MTVMDCEATLLTIAQKIQFILHHSVSTRTLRHRLQQNGMSARRQWLRLRLAGNHRCLNSGRKQRNGTTLCLPTNLASACNITMIGSELVDGVIELLPGPACSPNLQPIENVFSMLAQRLARDALPLLHQINFGNMWTPLELLYPKDTS